MRVFIGSPIPPSLAKRIHHVTSRALPAEFVRIVPYGNYHVTLAFLGEVEDSEIPEICRSMDELAARSSPVSFSFGQLHAFPERSQPRTIVLQLQEGRSEAAELIDRYQRRFIRRKGGRIIPHVTVGRVKKGRTLDRKLLSERIRIDEGLSGRLDRIVLYESELERSGAVYTPLHTIRLYQ